MLLYAVATLVHGDSSRDGSEKALNSPETQCGIGFQPVCRTERCKGLSRSAVPNSGVLLGLSGSGPARRLVQHLTAGKCLQVSCVPEKRRGQRQLTLFWTLLVGKPTTQSVVIHPDPGSNRFLCIARFCEIPLQRSQQLIRANYTFS